MNRTHIYSPRLIVSEWKIVFVFNNINVVYLLLANEFTLHTHADTQAYIYIWMYTRARISADSSKKKYQIVTEMCDKFTQVLTLSYFVYRLNQRWVHHTTIKRNIFEMKHIFSFHFSIYCLALKYIIHFVWVMREGIV